VTSYTATTANNTNKVTATAGEDAILLLEVNGALLGNGTSATWVDGENVLTITVTENGKATTEYTMTVTKS
jgi:hypothetical protein